jgi:DNA-binding Lrp family transcriptional regulator
VATLARLLKVSRGTVQNRIDRLLEERTLLGFTVRTTPEASYRIRAVTMVRTEGDAAVVGGQRILLRDSHLTLTVAGR